MVTARRAPSFAHRPCVIRSQQHMRKGLLQDVFLTPGFLAIASEYADLGSLRDYMGRCSRQVSVLLGKLSATSYQATQQLAGTQRLPVSFMQLCIQLSSVTASTCLRLCSAMLANRNGYMLICHVLAEQLCWTQMICFWYS